VGSDYPNKVENKQRQNCSEEILTCKTNKESKERTMNEIIKATNSKESPMLDKGDWPANGEEKRALHFDML